MRELRLSVLLGLRRPLSAPCRQERECRPAYSIVVVSQRRHIQKSDWSSCSRPQELLLCHDSDTVDKRPSLQSPSRSFFLKQFERASPEEKPTTRKISLSSSNLGSATRAQTRSRRPQRRSGAGALGLQRTRTKRASPSYGQCSSSGQHTCHPKMSRNPNAALRTAHEPGGRHWDGQDCTASPSSVGSGASGRSRSPFGRLGVSAPSDRFLSHAPMPPR